MALIAAQLRLTQIADSRRCSNGLPCAPPLLPTQPSTAGHRFVALTGFFVVYKFFRLPATAAVAELEQVRWQSVCFVLLLWDSM